MTVSSITSQPTVPVQSHHHHGGGRKAEQAAAQALGISTDDLRTALQQGQSIASLAQTQGVPLDSVTSAVSAAIGSVSAAPRSMPGPPPPIRDAFAAAATSLGLSSDELHSQLDGGQTLASIAQGKGVDVATVAAAMATALQSDDSSLTAGDAATEAQQLMDGPPAHRSGVLARALGSVAQALGVDAPTLGHDLMSGESLGDVASAKGVSSADLLKTFAGALQQADPDLSDDDATAVAQQLLDVRVSSARATGTYTTAAGVSDPSVSSLA